jgi:hypothetical protein
MHMRGVRSLACVVALLACTASHAAGVVIYRCTDAFGALTVQNDVPCPKGTKQQKQVIEPPPPMPAYQPVVRPAPQVPVLAPAPAVAEPPPAPVTRIPDGERLPPPALYQCNTYDHDSYLSEDPTPEPRCVRLETTDLSGAANSAGTACQMVTDQCQRVADGAACAAWKKRLREVEAAWKFARADDVEANRVEFERAQRIVRDSTCGR